VDIIVFPDSFTIQLIGGMLSYIDCLFPNEDESRMFTGKETLDEMANSLLNYGVRRVIIKRGKSGCFIKTKNE
jgi:sugar/nucleoside kinase (ribokinase family)